MISLLMNIYVYEYIILKYCIVVQQLLKINTHASIFKFKNQVIFNVTNIEYNLIYFYTCIIIFIFVLGFFSWVFLFQLAPYLIRIIPYQNF